MTSNGEKEVKFRRKNSGLSAWMDTILSSGRQFIILAPYPIPVEVLVDTEPVISHPLPEIIIATVFQVVLGCIIKGTEFRTREVVLLSP